MDISQTNWNETDASNSSAAPDGAPEGMAPSGVDDTIRAVMGAAKRLYNQLIPATTAGTSTAFTLSYSVIPTALANGMTFLVKFNQACGAAPTLNINTLGAKPLYKWQGGAWVAVAAGDIVSGQKLRVTYDATSGNFHILQPIGTAAQYNVGTGANNVVQLDGNGKLPAVDGSQLTGLTPAWVTGNWRFTHNTTAASGWMMWVDGTIGNALSNATVRANADTAALFAVYWAISSLQLYTSAGATVARGATAAADYAANCAIALPLGPGRAPVIAGSGSGLTARALGASGGAETHAHGGATGQSNNQGVDNASTTSGGNPLQTTSHTHNIGSDTLMQPWSASNAEIKL